MARTRSNAIQRMPLEKKVEVAIDLIKRDRNLLGNKELEILIRDKNFMDTFRGVLRDKNGGYDKLKSLPKQEVRSAISQRLFIEIENKSQLLIEAAVSVPQFFMQLYASGINTIETAYASAAFTIEKTVVVIVNGKKYGVDFTNLRGQLDPDLAVKFAKQLVEAHQAAGGNIMRSHFYEKDSNGDIVMSVATNNSFSATKGYSQTGLRVTYVMYGKGEKGYAKYFVIKGVFEHDKHNKYIRVQ